MDCTQRFALLHGPKDSAVCSGDIDEDREKDGW